MDNNVYGLILSKNQPDFFLDITYESLFSSE